MGAVTRARGAGVDESLRRVTGMSTTLSMSCAIGTEVPHLDRAMGFLQNASRKVCGIPASHSSTTFAFARRRPWCLADPIPQREPRAFNTQLYYHTFILFASSKN